MTEGKYPVYPTPIAGGDNNIVSALDNDYNVNSGLTKREYFAAMAMQGLLSNHIAITEPIVIANKAIKYADELLKQL